jgi:hypothetical protein
MQSKELLSPSSEDTSVMKKCGARAKRDLGINYSVGKRALEKPFKFGTPFLGLRLKSARTILTLRLFNMLTKKREMPVRSEKMSYIIQASRLRLILYKKKSKDKF